VPSATPGATTLPTRRLTAPWPGTPSRRAGWRRGSAGNKDAQEVIFNAARILPLWPRATKAEIQAARPAAPAKARRTVERAHSWVCSGSKWHCRVCLAATFSEDGVHRRSKEECPDDAAAVRRVVDERRGHSLMVAGVDGGPCLFCATCGVWCTTKPRDLLLPCGGRGGRTPDGLAALVRLRNGFAPDCGEWRGRRVHAVEALHGVALEHWSSVPMSDRCCRLARQANAATGRASSQSPARDGTPPRLRPSRAASADSTQDFLASLGDDPLDRACAAAIARSRARAAGQPSGQCERWTAQQRG
jgi:hypothetical protein